MTSTPESDWIFPENFRPHLVTQGSAGTRVMEILTALTPEEGEFSTSGVVERALAYLDEREPALLSVWLREVGQQTLHDFLRTRLKSDRATWARNARGRAFTAAAASAAAGDNTALSTFSLSYVINEESIRRRVGEMTRADHIFVANSYRESADRLVMLEAFHVAIAKRIGVGQTTADVMTEEEYTNMYLSIVGPKG